MKMKSVAFTDDFTRKYVYEELCEERKNARIQLRLSCHERFYLISLLPVTAIEK